MKDKIAAELMKQHNLELERQEAVVKIFRLEEELKRVREEKDSETTQLSLKLKMTEEGLCLTAEDLFSSKFHSIKKVADRGTDTTDLKLPSQPSSQRTSVAAIRIPHPKEARGRKVKEDSMESEDVLVDQGEELGENKEILVSTRRQSSATKPKPISTKMGGSARQRTVLSNTRQSLDRLPKVRDFSPSAKKRRNTEFFPNKSKNMTSIPIEHRDGNKSSIPDSCPCEVDGVNADVPELSLPTPTEAEELSDDLSPLVEDSRCTSARLLPNYSRTRSKSFQLEVSVFFSISLGHDVYRDVIPCQKRDPSPLPYHAKSPWQKMTGLSILPRRKRRS